MKQVTWWRSVCLALMVVITTDTQTVRAEDLAAVQQLGEEVAEQGWSVFAGYPAEIDTGKIIMNVNDRGPLDLYLVRPDGSELRNITQTEAYHEFGGRFLPDGKRLLYRQLPKNKSINHDLWGSHGRLVIADLDGSDPVVYGKDGEYPWASFGPNSKRIACLDKQNGKIRKLIYGNIAKHCYFGCTSPDDKYVLFADDLHDGLVVGEMRVLRLADTPIIPKSLKMLKMLYPGSNEGPVFSLKLPNGVPLRGFEPHWTFAKIGASR